MFKRFLRRPRAAGETLPIGENRAADIMRLIRAGWTSVWLCSAIDEQSNERELNQHLREGMRAAANTGAVRSWRRISVFGATESEPLDETVHEGFPDISIHLRDVRERQAIHGPHAVIECKRIAGSEGELSVRYVKKGVDRFVSGKYAAQHSVGFMVGYVLSGGAALAVERVNQYVRAQGRGVECLGASTLFPDQSQARTSLHSRLGQGHIVLHHTMLEFA